MIEIFTAMQAQDMIAHAEAQRLVALQFHREPWQEQQTRVVEARREAQEAMARWRAARDEWVRTRQ